MSDLVSREAAIEYLITNMNWYDEDGYESDDDYKRECITELINGVPSAQPEIIRCKDCKYQDENWRRVSVRWLPCMDMRTGSNWYCGYAERRTDE